MDTDSASDREPLTETLSRLNQKHSQLKLFTLENSQLTLSDGITLSWLRPMGKLLTGSHHRLQAHFLRSPRQELWCSWQVVTWQVLGDEVRDWWGVSRGSLGDLQGTAR